jgi:EmrB/QacA subfamily drug resistance transporter
MLLSVALGTFMSALDASVVNIAAPVIKSHFAVPLSTVEWVITAYLLVVSSVLLFFGRLSDLYGQKRVYITGFGIFTVGSLLCGLSSSIGMLIALRVVQALGAGMMFSTNSAIITANVPEEKRGRAFSVNAMAVAVALSTGPVLGGALTGALGWQSIFYINIPVGIAGVALAVRFIPADTKKPAVPMDIPGSAMIFFALLLILLPLNQLGAGLPTWLFCLLLGLGAVLTAVFIFYQRRAQYPILSLSLFSCRVFSASLAAALLNYMAQYILVFLTPFYMQTVRLFTPAMSGLLYMPLPLATLSVAPLAGVFSDRHDTRILSSAGMGVMAIGMFLLSRMGMDTPLWYIIVSMAVTGIGSGLFQTPNNSALMGSAPAEFRGVASGMLATARNIGMVLGVAFSGLLFSVFAGGAGESATAALAETSPSTFVSAMRLTFIVAACVAVGAMVASLTKGRTRERKTKDDPRAQA